MSNRISVEPIHGMQGGTDKPCIACGKSYCLTEYVEAIDHAIGKKYQFAISTCECGRTLNKAALRKKLPGNIFNAVFN